MLKKTMEHNNHRRILPSFKDLINGCDSSLIKYDCKLPSFKQLLKNCNLPIEKSVLPKITYYSNQNFYIKSNKINNKPLCSFMLYNVLNDIRTDKRKLNYVEFVYLNYLEKTYITLPFEDYPIFDSFLTVDQSITLKMITEKDINYFTSLANNRKKIKNDDQLEYEDNSIDFAVSETLKNNGIIKRNFIARKSYYGLTNTNTLIQYKVKILYKYLNKKFYQNK